MGNRNAALKRYYRKICNCLPSSHKLKVKVLAEIESNINAYLIENPSADIAAIEARFGTPEQISSAYIDELGTSVLLRKLQFRKKFLAIVVSTVTIMLVLWLIALGWASIREYKHSNGSATHSSAIEVTP